MGESEVICICTVQLEAISALYIVDTKALIFFRLLGVCFGLDQRHMSSAFSVPISYSLVVFT